MTAFATPFIVKNTLLFKFEKCVPFTMDAPSASVGKGAQQLDRSVSKRD